MDFHFGCEKCVASVLTPKWDCRRKCHAYSFRVRVVSGNLPILPPSCSFVGAKWDKRRVVGHLNQANALIDTTHTSFCSRYGLTGFAVHGYKPSVQHSKLKSDRAAKRLQPAQHFLVPTTPVYIHSNAKQIYALTMCYLDWLYHNRNWIGCGCNGHGSDKTTEIQSRC